MAQVRFIQNPKTAALGAMLALSFALDVSLSCEASTLTEPTLASAVIDAQNRFFDHPHIIRSGANVYTAVGYHAATMSMIVGRDGVVVIDSLSGPTAASQAYEALRKASGSTLPLKALIYTHSHMDHIGGAAGFVKPESDVRIIGPAGMNPANGIDPALKPAMKTRITMQFGRALPREERTNVGVGPANTIDHDMGKGFIKPTEIVEDAVQFEIAGVKLHLEKAAGETDDAMFIWLPEEKILFSGDNFYQAFPNLYAIRGTPYRDVRVWADTVEKLATLNAEHLVAGHTDPIHGKEAVKEALSDYAEGIRWVFRKTVEGMNRLEDPVTIARSIELPAHLAKKPWMSEVYGSVENSSRAVYAGLIGWFDGNATNLHPLTTPERAERWVKNLGGMKAGLDVLEKALADGDCQWVLELGDMLRTQTANENERRRVTAAQVRALRVLGSRESNVPNRNYYLSWAHRLEAQLR